MTDAKAGMRLDHPIGSTLREAGSSWPSLEASPSLAAVADPASPRAFAFGLTEEHATTVNGLGLRFVFFSTQLAWLALVAYLYLG